MTGIYMRVFRGGKWQNIELEFMTDAERAATFTDNERTVQFLNAVCQWITGHVFEELP